MQTAATGFAVASWPHCLLLPAAGHAQGINVTSLREIKLLREIKSPYVVELLDVFPHKRKVNMVRHAAQGAAASAAAAAAATAATAAAAAPAANQQRRQQAPI